MEDPEVTLGMMTYPVQTYRVYTGYIYNNDNDTKSFSIKLSAQVESFSKTAGLITLHKQVSHVLHPC